MGSLAELWTVHTAQRGKSEMKSQRRRRRRKRWSGNWKLLLTHTHRQPSMSGTCLDIVSERKQCETHVGRRVCSKIVLSKRRYFHSEKNTIHLNWIHVEFAVMKTYKHEFASRQPEHMVNEQQTPPICWGLHWLPSVVFGGELILNYDFFLASITAEMEARLSTNQLNFIFFPKTQSMRFLGVVRMHFCCVRPTQIERRKPHEIKQTNVNNLYRKTSFDVECK